MGEYNILFCLSNSISNIKNKLQDYCNDKDFSFQIEHVSCYKDFLNVEDISKYHCVIIQEYLSEENPIDVEFLSEFFPKNIVVIGIFHEDKREFYGKALYKNNLYNCFFGEDANKILLSDLVGIILNGRSKAAAKLYYNISCTEDMNINHEIQCKNKIAGRKKTFDYMNTTARKILPVNSYNSMNIGVVSLSRGAGSTFFAMNFAAYLSREFKITLIEHPNLDPYMYYYLGLNAMCCEGFANHNSIFHLIENGESVHGKEYVDKNNKNLNWIFSDPNFAKISNWNEDKMLRLLYYPKETVVNIVDIGQELLHESIYNIIEQFTVLFIIVDPMLPNLLSNYEYLNDIKEFALKKGIQVEFIINKYVNNIQKNLLEDYLGYKLKYFIPQIDLKYIYEAVYYGIVTLELKETNRLLCPVFEKLASKYLNVHIKKKRKIF